MVSTKIQKYSFKDLEEGRRFDFGSTSLSEQEIIDFALAFDPLDIHTDMEAAKKGFFKGLIASGPHIFNLVHRTKWIPLFKDTVICGLEVNNWKFLKPIYANRVIHSSVTINKLRANIEKKQASVTWFYEFRDEKGELVQSLEMTVLHKIN